VKNQLSKNFIATIWFYYGTAEKVLVIYGRGVVNGSMMDVIIIRLLLPPCENAHEKKLWKKFNPKRKNQWKIR